LESLIQCTQTKAPDGYVSIPKRRILLSPILHLHKVLNLKTALMKMIAKDIRNYKPDAKCARVRFVITEEF